MRPSDDPGRDLADLMTRPPVAAVDLRVGDWIDIGPSEPISEEEIIAFATRYDPLPIHVDPASAAATHFGGVVASGMQTMSLYASISTPAFVRNLALVAGKGIDRMRLPVPVRPGTRLRGRIEITAITDRGDRSDLGMHSSVYDDAGALVLDLHSVLVLETRRRADATGRERGHSEESFAAPDRNRRASGRIR